MRSNQIKHIFVAISFITLLLVLSNGFIFANSAENTTDLPEDIEGISVLALVGSNVGDNFLDIRDTLESWNVSVTTVAQFSNNILTHGGTTVSVDVTIGDLDEDSDLDEFDALIVPSGAWWLGVSSNPTMTNFIGRVYEHGLIVGSMCVGCGILGAADIVEGKKVLCHANSAYLITNAGGIRIGTYDIVSDSRIVTGATGTGVSGHQNAPYMEFSQTIIKECLGLRYLTQCTIEGLEDTTENFLSISVTTQTLHELDQILTGDERNISEVEAIFYPHDASLYPFTVQLDEITENAFEGFVDKEITGNYTVKVEVSTDFGDLEISTVNLDLGSPENSIPGYPLSVILLSSIIALGVSILITRKRLLRK